MSSATIDQVNAINFVREEAAALAEWERIESSQDPLAPEQITGQLRLLIDRVMGEAGLYAPREAAAAILQAGGDPSEAAYLLRAFSHTLERPYRTEIIDTENMAVERRISSSFREIPEGQILGPTRDYTQRMLRSELAEEDSDQAEQTIDTLLSEESLGRDRQPRHTFSRVTALLRSDGLMDAVAGDSDNTDPVCDLTRNAQPYPSPRSATLQALARGETGAVMAIGYASQRGYGGGHGTVGELRLGQVALRVKDRRGRIRPIGRIRVTECEMVGRLGGKEKGALPKYAVGYGLCFGQNETKAICMGKLESALRHPDTTRPPNDQEFVLSQIDGTEASGCLSSFLVESSVEASSFAAQMEQASLARRKPEPAPAESLRS